MGRRKKKMKKGIITDGDGDEEDRISNLPESLIHHILSFLLMRDVIQTCLLSKRWRNIWKSVPVLNFGYDLPRGKDFIEQSLIHYEGQKVKTLQVQFQYYTEAGCVESWVRFAALHGVEELDLSAAVYEATNHTLPSFLSECLEMRVLRLSVGDCSPQPFCFPLLKELHFTDLTSNYFDTSACPLLEVLILQGVCICDSMEIYAPNPKLRYLKISESDYDIIEDDNSRLVLYAPNVLHFEFEGFFGRFYEFKGMSSVKTLSLYSSIDPSEYRMAESLVEILRNLSHVKSLRLSQSCIRILAYGETVGLQIPPLSAICLELKTNLFQCVLVGITSLLSASRSIERLIINMEDRNKSNERIFEVHDIETIDGWESLEHALSVELALNTILIQNFPGFFPECHRDWFKKESNMEKFVEYFDSEFKLVEVLLKSSKRLNKMNISIMKLPSQPLYLQYLDGLTKKLLVFPRASLNAEVYIS